MAVVDIRAKVYCSLGRLISGEIADSYSQGNGLIKCRGSVRLNGSYSPPLGTRVYFAVLKDNRISKINRELRVLSSFTHPFTGVTTVQLGCSLIYLSNSAETPDEKGDLLFGVDDPINEDIPCPLRKYLALPIRASQVFSHAVSKLRLSHSGISLNSQFSKETFKFENGYVNVIDGLLISENYCAFINGSGVLQGINLNGGGGGSGPVLNQNNIIRLEGINSGDLPAKAVFVRYTTKKLKKPEIDESSEDKLNKVSESSYFVSEAVDTYSEINADGSRTTYTNLFDYQGKETLEEEYDSDGRLIQRIRSSGGPFEDTTTVSLITYPPSVELTAEDLDVCGLPKPKSDSDLEGPSSEYSTTSGPALDLCRRCGYDGSGFAAPVKRMTLEQRLVIYKRSGDTTSTTEQIKIPYYQTPHGSVAIDREMQARQDAARKISEYVGPGEAALSEEGVTWDIGFQADLFERARRLTVYGSKTKVRSEKRFGLEVIKPLDEQKNELNALSENGPDVEESVEIAWALGSEGAETSAEYTMPYPPDDVIRWLGEDNFIVISGHAEQVATSFGRMQNRLLLGNRSGVNIQIPYELMPPKPLDSIYINAANLVGNYRINGTSYVFNSDGIIASTDALFWGAVGRIA
jgi:hypothetical protein